MLDEARLARYLDYAIREFNSVVGLVPAAVAIKDSHGYYGFLWKLGQNPKYAVSWREHHELYEWMKVYPVKHLEYNEFYLLLYVNQHRVHGLKYVFENERVRRESQLLDGYRLPSFSVNEFLEEFKCEKW